MCELPHHGRGKLGEGARVGPAAGGYLVPGVHRILPEHGSQALNILCIDIGTCILIYIHGHFDS